MDKSIFKERFEYIIGFLALVISLNGFKTELDSITINFTYFSITLSQYFFYIILTVILCLHLYFIPHFIKGESKFSIRFKAILLGTVYFFLFLIVLSPFSLTLLFFVLKYLDVTAKILKTIVVGIIGGFAGLAGGYAYTKVKQIILETKLSILKSSAQTLFAFGKLNAKEFETLKADYAANREKALNSGDAELIANVQKLDKKIADLQKGFDELKDIESSL